MRLKIILGLIVIGVFFYFSLVHRKLFLNEKTNQTNSVNTQIIEIRKEDYQRYILTKKTHSKYLLEMIKEYGELSGNGKYQEHSFWLGINKDWHILKIGNSINFYNYHNLVGWFMGYEDNIAIPELSIGFAKHKSDSQQDYVFYLDPNISAGDTEIGTFRSGNPLYIYLPEAYEEFGNLTITNNHSMTMVETLKFISENGLEISLLDSIDFVEHRIRMYE
jgi:hypothetical protein